MELIAEYDPFLSQHLSKYGILGKGNTFIFLYLLFDLNNISCLVGKNRKKLDFDICLTISEWICSLKRVIISYWIWRLVYIAFKSLISRCSFKPISPLLAVNRKRQRQFPSFSVGSFISIRPESLCPINAISCLPHNRIVWIIGFKDERFFKMSCFF